MFEQLCIAIKRAAFNRKSFSIAGSEFSHEDAKKFENEIKKLLEAEYKRGFSNGLYAVRNEINERFGL